MFEKNYHWDAVSKGPSGPTKVYLSKQRKDGKYMATYVYARNIRKLITQAEADSLRLDTDYTVLDK